MENYEFPQVDEVMSVDEPEVEEKEEKNVLQPLVDAYNEMVKEHDKQGFADIFKNSTENLLASLTIFFKRDDIDFTPVDVEYGDGYFIFGRGSNSTITFHVKEAPGWLFGLWWRPQKIHDSTDENPVYESSYIKGEMFAQYEDEIDKFKPSASTFETEFSFDIDLPVYSEEEQNNWSALYNCREAFRLILTEPDLALYREIEGIDFNSQYISREEAIKFRREFLALREEQAIQRKANDVMMLQMVKYIIQPLLDEDYAFIYDEGENSSPRYEIVIKNIDDNKEQNGYYFLFDENNEDREVDEKLWDQTVESCTKAMEDLGSYWFSSVDKFYLFLDTKKYEEVKQRCYNEGVLVDLNNLS